MGQRIPANSPPRPGIDYPDPRVTPTPVDIWGALGQVNPFLTAPAKPKPVQPTAVPVMNLGAIGGSGAVVSDTPPTLIGGGPVVDTPPPPPVTPPPLTGASTSSSVKTKTTTKRSGPLSMGTQEPANNLPVQQSDYDVLVGRLNDAQIESLRNQKEGISQLEEYVNRVKNREGQMDLSPFMSLYDSWFGGNMAAGYKRPMTAEERDAQLFQLESAVQRARGGLSDTEVELIKAQLGIEDTKLARAERADARAAQTEIEERRIAEARKERWQRAQEHADNMAIERGIKLNKQEQEDRYKMLKTDEKSVIEGSIKLANAAREYDALVAKYGMEPFGEGAAELDRAYTALTTAFKDAEKLGALAAADMQLVRGNVSNAGGLSNYLANLAKGRDAQAIRTQIRDVLSATDTTFARNMDVLDKAFPGKSTEDLRQEFRTQYQGVRKPASTRQGLESQFLGQ